MTRRNFIALVSLCVLVALGTIVVGVGVFATQSTYGQEWLRKRVQAQVAAAVTGKVHVGRISGSFLTGLTIDSLELRDDEDSLFVATGRVTVRYDPRDLIDRRLYIRRLDVEHPTVVLRQHESWEWNYRRMFRRSGGEKPRGGPERGFADFVLLDSVRLRGGASFRLTFPWHPDDSLGGARRDSAVRANVARQDHEIRRTSEGLTQTYRWTNAYAFLPHVRIADPDSVGMKFVIDTMHADESTPPFAWRNVRGVARVVGDTAWFTASRWDLARSTGRAEGRVVWGSDLPVRYAVQAVADSISMSDVAWVYPTLPTTGGGRLKLDIRNEADLHRLDFVVHDMDIRTTKSRIRGKMTFETGGPVLAVHDVDIVADPVDFDLLRTLNGGPFPADWQGRITGTVVARGGPVTNFFVDASDLTFRDAHVRGAVSRVRGRGELDILFPAFTAFHSFRVAAAGVDLRTLAAIYPAFPRMTGIVSGTVVLDSSWLDVRASNANLTHTDGPAEPTRATGGGRITYGEQFMTYDMTLQAAPLSLTTLARSYPMLPLRGTFNGPVTIRGIAPDLDVTGDLTGAAGRITYAGKADADSIGGYGARGSGTFDALDAAALLGRSGPEGRLAGRFDVDLLGDSLDNLAGSLAVSLDRSVVEGVRIAHGATRLRFDRGALLVDSARVVADAGTLRARGTLGLTRPAGSDSLAFAVDVDSLGGLRHYLGRTDDSLSGRLTLRGTVHGWLDSLDLRGALSGRNVYVRGNRARSVAGEVTLRDVAGGTSGRLALRADTAVAAGIGIDSASMSADIVSRSLAHFRGGARTESGAILRTAGSARSVLDTTGVSVDTLNLAIGTSRWSLRQSSNFARSGAGVSLDTLHFGDATGALVTGFMDAPSAADARIHLRAESVPLADVGLLARLPSGLAGRLSLDLGVNGPRTRPVMTMSARATNVQYAGLSTDVVTVGGGYRDERATLDADVLRGGRSILDASVSYPLALTLFSAHTTGDSLSGRVHADSVELALVEALSARIRGATGLLALDLSLSGLARDPHVGGRATITNGGFELPDIGVRVVALQGLVTVDPLRDSLTVQHLTLVTPASGGTASLHGSVVFRDLARPRLDLRLDAQRLRAVDKRGLARLDVSTGASGLTLAGTRDAATLSGAVDVDRGTIYIPELVRKQVVDLTAEDFAQLFDTTDVRNRSLMPQPPSALVEHLLLEGVSVRLGDEVWLRSREANIKLGGSLNVTRAIDTRETTRSSIARDARADSARYRLALAGTLSADRGTYTLDLTAVQREFLVQSGRITFFGTSDFNPEIDVTAVYNVKQASRADIGIRARIHGNFYPQPALELSSSDAYLSPSDLVSYLVTGRPSFDLSGQDVAASRRAYEFLLPTVGASVSRALREQLGGVVDAFQIQSGAVVDPLSVGTSQGQLGSILSSTRLGGEKQISDRLYLSFSTGLCQLGATSDDPAQQGLNGFVNAIEGKLEYRFPLLAPDRLALRAGREPAASALRCGADRVRGFVATPQQWGLSLFRSWSF